MVIEVNPIPPQSLGKHRKVSIGIVMFRIMPKKQDPNRTLLLLSVSALFNAKESAAISASGTIKARRFMTVTIAG
jgi:hypothetical protein